MDKVEFSQAAGALALIVYRTRQQGGAGVLGHYLDTQVRVNACLTPFPSSLPLPAALPFSSASVIFLCAFSSLVLFAALPVSPSFNLRVPSPSLSSSPSLPLSHSLSLPLGRISGFSSLQPTSPLLTLFFLGSLGYHAPICGNVSP